MTQLSWQAPEYIHSPRTSDWYWTVGIITGALAVTSIIFGNYLLALLLIISVFALTLFSFREPLILSIEITDKGLRINKELHSYTTFSSFGIDEGIHGNPRLFLTSKKMLSPETILPLPEEGIDDIREALKNHLTETEVKENPARLILERLGF